MRNSSLELLRDAFGNQLCVQLRLSNFMHVDMDIRVLILLRNNSLKLLGQLVDALATAADNCAGACGVQRYANAIRRALDVDTANVAHAQAPPNERANGVIASQKESVCLLVRKPVAIRV